MMLVAIKVTGMAMVTGMVTNNRHCECERSVVDD